MAFPHNQYKNLLNEIQTKLSTYEPNGYFSLAKYFQASEDRINLDQSQKDEAQNKNAVFYLIPQSSIQDESFYEDFRIYPVVILWKFRESNLDLADEKNRKIADAIRDIFWRKISGTYYYNCGQTGSDDFNPAVSEQTLKIDGNLEQDGKKLIHRGSQTWNFYTVIDHQVVDLSTVKSGTATAGERI